MNLLEHLWITTRKKERKILKIAARVYQHYIITEDYFHLFFFS